MAKKETLKKKTTLPRTTGRKVKSGRVTPLKLYFVRDSHDFECDFVIAKTERGAWRVFDGMYGFGEGAQGKVELVTVLKTAPAWVKGPMWLGPTANLSELGGIRLTSIDFPRWRFGDKVWGPPKTGADRYRLLR
jgi:hypothetical protein